MASSTTLPRISGPKVPEAQFLFSGDRAYPCVAGRLPVNVQTVSRIRRDAALYAPPPKRRKKGPGRPAKKGKRLPSPQGMAKQVGKRWKIQDFVAESLAKVA